MGPKSDPHGKAMIIAEERGFFIYFRGINLVVTLFGRSEHTQQRLP